MTAQNTLHKARTKDVNIYENFKRILKLLGIIIMALFACFGMVIAGPIPFLPLYKNDSRFEIKIEKVIEEKEEDSEFEEWENRS